MDESLKIEQTVELFDLADMCKGELQGHFLAMLDLVGEFMSVHENSPYKNPYDINYLEHFKRKISETDTSWLIGTLLQYQKDGEFVLLKSFLKRFLATSTPFDLAWVRKPEITIEIERFDIRILEEDYVVIIENKLKGADYQCCQLGRYIQKMKDKGYKDEQIFIILIPGYVPDAHYKKSLAESTWKYPGDYQKVKEIKCHLKDGLHCWCDDEEVYSKLTARKKVCCSGCISFKHTKPYKQTVVVHKGLSEWLKGVREDETLVPSNEILLKATMVLFEDFLNVLYVNRDNDKLKADMIDFLKEKLVDDKKTLADNVTAIEKKIEDLSTLQEYMESLRYDLYSEMVKSWYATLKTEWDGLIEDADAGFYIKTKGMKIGCWLDEDDEYGPYWGIRTDNDQEPSQTKIKKAEQLLDKVSMGQDGTDSRDAGWLFYGYTKEGDVILNRLFKVAQELL